jgi:hypothetical protein
MNLFRKSKTITIQNTQITVYEMSVKSLLKLSRNDYNDSAEILKDNTSLSNTEFENLSIEAFNLLLKEFEDLNKEHLGINAGNENKEDLNEKK